jgi:hypothetical protein
MTGNDRRPSADDPRAGVPSCPNSCLGACLCETPFRALFRGRMGNSSFADGVPKQEFGNEGTRETSASLDLPSWNSEQARSIISNV